MCVNYADCRAVEKCLYAVLYVCLSVTRVLRHNSYYHCLIVLFLFSHTNVGCEFMIFDWCMATYW